MSFVDWFKNRLVKGPADLGFAVATVSACGPVRRENQDSLLSIPSAGFFCVADGMGGGKGGALASRWICEAFGTAAKTAGFPVLPGPKRRALVDAMLQTANERIRTYAREQGYRSMGSTVAMMVFDPLDMGHPALVHAGDSRIYRLRRGTLQLLTRDHTVGDELGSKAHSRMEAADLKSRRNPLSHILTRAVGTEFRVRPDWQQADARIGDRFLICTDGVHDMLTDAEIARAMKGRVRPDAIAHRLEEAILAAGAGDNYTLICIEVRRK